MSQPGGNPYGQPSAPQFHPHSQQRQRPSAHQQPPSAFSYGTPPQGHTPPQFHSQQQGNPHPFPGMASGTSMSHRPMSAPQQFYSSPDFQQPSHPKQPTSYGFAQPNASFPQAQPTRPVAPQAQSSPHLHVEPDFINQLSQNPMAGLAMNTAQDFLTKQSAMYLPGAYGVWGSVKYYFTVNNSYVKSRLKMLLMPFWHGNWRRVGSGESGDGKAYQYAPPTRDVNAPDLYIPLMGFLTYILIVGYSKGTSNQFSPDVIGKDASYCLVMQLVEIGVLAACLYLLNSSVSFLDLVSFSGYKYIPLVINAIVYQLFGSIAYYGALLYTGVAVSYFTLNCMKGSVAEPTPETRAFRNYLLFGVSCLQLVLVCWISYTTAPRE